MSEQQIMKFTQSHSFFEEDFIFEDTNKSAYELIYKFPEWPNNLVNLVGPKKSGKTHLLKILEKKHSFYYVNEESFDNHDLDNLFETQKLILDFNRFSEKELFLLVNDFYTNKKYLIISSNIPLIQMPLNLKDLVSRSKLFNIIEILNPSDKLVYSLILKFFSDNQIQVKKELANFIVKKIDRSYQRINEFLKKLNDQSSRDKKKIDYKMINRVIETFDQNPSV